MRRMVGGAGWIGDAHLCISRDARRGDECPRG